VALALLALRQGEILAMTDPDEIFELLRSFISGPALQTSRSGDDSDHYQSRFATAFDTDELFQTVT
jgi:hypothetical protein